MEDKLVFTEVTNERRPILGSRGGGYFWIPAQTAWRNAVVFCHKDRELFTEQECGRVSGT